MRHTVLVLMALGGTACTQRVEIGAFGHEAGGASGEGGGEGGGEPSFDPLPRSRARLSAAVASTCARTSNGGAACWGNNTAGELGVNDESLGMSAAALTPIGLADGVFAIFGGGSAHCATRDDGRVLCWGASLYGEFEGMPVQAYALQPLEQPGLGDDVVQLTLGLSWGCALSREGTAKCWGLGGNGQLGHGGTDDAYVPRDVGGSNRFVHLAASNGGFHTCGVTSTGGVSCWGDNTHGQLGAPGPNQTLPAAVSLEGIVEVAAGARHSCARSETGAVWCWGDASSGQLGGTDSAVSPLEVAGLPSATALAAGGDATCLISDVGGVWCWGAMAPDVPPSPPTEVVEASFGAAEIACGSRHGCAIDATHRVRCWGADDRGQAGGGELAL